MCEPHRPLQGAASGRSRVISESQFLRSSLGVSFSFGDFSEMRLVLPVRCSGESVPRIRCERLRHEVDPSDFYRQCLARIHGVSSGTAPDIEYQGRVELPFDTIVIR
jgi:hypothetical protein